MEPYILDTIEIFKYKLDSIENTFPLCTSVINNIHYTNNEEFIRYPLIGKKYNDLINYIKKYIRIGCNDITPLFLKEFGQKKIIDLDFHINVPNGNTDNNNIIITHGSDNALRICLDFLSNQKDLNNNLNILIPSPNYPHFIDMAQIRNYNIIYVHIDHTDDINLVFSKIFNSLINNITLCYLSNPNLPIGYCLSSIQLETLISTYTNTIFILDEAYFEYGTLENNIYLINKYNNIIITRTFSKFFGLANLRIGYLITNNNLFKKIRLFHNYKDISNYSLSAAIISLQNIDFYYNNLKDFNTVKLYITNRLKSFISKDKYIYNYNMQYGLFFLIFSKDSSKIKEYFKNLNIFIRDKKIDIPNANRITISTFNVMKEVLDLLENINLNNDIL